MVRRGAIGPSSLGKQFNPAEMITPSRVKDVQPKNEKALSTLDVDKKVKPKNALLKKVLADQNKKGEQQQPMQPTVQKDQSKIYEQNLRTLRTCAYSLVSSLSASLDKTEVELKFDHPTDPLRDLRSFTQKYTDIQETLSERSEAREKIMEEKKQKEAKKAAAPPPPQKLLPPRRESVMAQSGFIPLTKKTTIIGGIVLDSEHKIKKPEVEAKTPVVYQEDYYLVKQNMPSLKDVKREKDFIFETRVANGLFSQLVIAEFSSFFFAHFGLALSIILQELQMNDLSETFASDVALIYNMFCTICLIGSLYVRYDLWLTWSKSVNRFTEYDTLVTTGTWRSMAFEMLIAVIAPYPFLESVKVTEKVFIANQVVEYKVNDILLFIMFMRLYLCGRFIFYLTQFLNPRTQRVCSINGCDSDSFFALKGLMKQRPFTILLGSLVVSLFICGYQIRIFEGPLTMKELDMGNDPMDVQDFTSMWNAIWNAVITLFSTGYGDLYPRTFYGRLVAMALCFWGVLITSLLVVSVTNMLNFTQNEERAYNLLMRLHYKMKLKKMAVEVLQAAFIHRNTKKEDPTNRALILSHFRVFRSHLIAFKKTAHLIRTFDREQKDDDVVQGTLENIMEAIKEMKAEQGKMIRATKKALEYMMMDSDNCIQELNTPKIRRQNQSHRELLEIQEKDILVEIKRLSIQMSKDNRW